MAEAVQLVNYCTHAIEDMRVSAKEAAARGLGVTAKRLHVVIEMLTHAQKFLLPNCAEMVDSESLDDVHLDLLQLPFPVTVFEAPWQKEVGETAIINGVRE
jgi:hypothetical protein